MGVGSSQCTNYYPLIRAVAHWFLSAGSQSYLARSSLLIIFFSLLKQCPFLMLAISIRTDLQELWYYLCVSYCIFEVFFYLLCIYIRHCHPVNESNLLGFLLPVKVSYLGEQRREKYQFEFLIFFCYKNIVRLVLTSRIIF